jgi:adenylate kinase family enzyme
LKIHIIGVSGSGKTYIADTLCEILNIPHYDLDDIFWNNFDGYGVKSGVNEREQKLNAILRQDNWIVEGVYYGWLQPSFNDADAIIMLDIPLKVCRRRVIYRFIKRKLGIEKGKYETIDSLKKLFKWMDKYIREDLPAIKKILQPFSDKVIIIKNNDDLKKSLCAFKAIEVLNLQAD